MARRRRSKPLEEEKPIYTEKIPLSLMPRKLLRGKKWNMFENLGRFVSLFLIFMAVLSLLYGLKIEYILIFLIGAVLLFYVTEFVSPDAQRTIRPIRIYKSGLLVYTTSFERLIGKKSYLTPDDQKGIKVRRMNIQTDAGAQILPTHLTFVLSSGMRIKMGRRNCTELQTIISMLNNLGIKEI